MLINSGFFGGLVTHYGKIFAPANAIFLCTGSMPTDGQVDAMTAVSDTLITGSKSVTYGGIPMTSMKAKDTAIPALIYANALPAISTVNATRAGTLTWGVLHGTNGFAIVDVGLVNSGSVIQVDNVNVSVGTPVTLLSLAYKMGR